MTALRAQPIAAALSIVLLVGLVPRGAAALAPDVAAASEEPPEAVLFGRTCGSCHGLGRDSRTGPDLLGVTERRAPDWLSTYIRSPGRLRASGDRLALQLAEVHGDLVMPDQPIADEELALLLGYIERCTAVGGCRLNAGQRRPATEATALELETGRGHFDGSRPLARGAASCLGCHSARGLRGGGTLGPELSLVHARLGDRRLAEALERPAGPVMKRVLGPRPLTPQESYALRGWLAERSRDGARAEAEPALAMLGACGALAVAIGLGLNGRAARGRRSPRRPG